MALFERFHLSQEEAEARLKRALTGDPTRGEIGLLAALSTNKLDDVQVVVPEKLGWTPRQLRSPQFEQRFVAGFHQALSHVAPTRVSPAREPLIPGLARGAVAVGHAPQLVRRMEQDPERAAKDLVRAAFSKLSEALPKPFRLMQDLARTVGRFRSRGE